MYGSPCYLHNKGVQLLQEMLRSSWGQSKILDLTFSDYLAALRHPQVKEQKKEIIAWSWSMCRSSSRRRSKSRRIYSEGLWNVLGDLKCGAGILFDCLHGSHCRHSSYGSCYTVALIFKPYAIPLHTYSKLKYYHFHMIQNDFRDSSLTLLESQQLL